MSNFPPSPTTLVLPPTMAQPQPPSQQRQPTPSEINRYTSTFHNVALLATIACPILALLPPRKLDFFTVGLVTTTVYSGNYLVREQSGRSMWQYARGQPAAATMGLSVEQTGVSKEVQQARQEMQRLPVEGKSVTEELHSQREAWKAQREKEIQDDLDVGKGFGEMITDQIWEVWNWGKGKGGDDD